MKKWIIYFLVFCLCAASLSVAALPDMVHGIDVSSYQGVINWTQVKADGVDYVILRAGTGLGKDTMFEENYIAAKEAGLHVGCYFYTYALTVEEAEHEAAQLLTLLEGKQLEYPVYFDIEDVTQQTLTNEQRTALCLAFLNKVKAAGWCGGVYASKYWFESLLDLTTLQKTGEIWWAQWTASATPDEDKSAYGMWQYASDGRVNGIYGDIDRNVAYIDYPSLMKEQGLNGYSPTPIPGDVDGNRQTTSTDARLVLQYTVEKVDETALDLTVADVDGDGKITTTDARLILQKSVGKIENYPLPPEE